MSRIERNVVYGMYSGLALLMDVHHPAQRNGYGVIHIAGSGWSAPLSLDAHPLKEQRHFQLEAKPLVEHGYTVFTINHRAAPRFKYPAAVLDAQRAVRFIRYHAAGYGIRADRIGAIGGSSGGHLVSLLGVLDGDGDPDDESPVNRQSAKVQCVVVRAAPTDFQVQDAVFFLDVRKRADLDANSEEARIIREASPLTHVDKHSAPFLLIHGEEDDVVPVSLSETFANALSQVGVPVELIRVPGAGHGPSLPGAAIAIDIGGEANRWFQQHLHV